MKLSVIALFLTILGTLFYAPYDLQAQPKLTAAGLPPEGNFYNLYTAEPAGINQGSQGALVTWDFDDLKKINEQTVAFVKASSTSYDSIFAALPDVYAAVYSKGYETPSGNISYHFYNPTTAALNLLAVANDQKVFLNYSDAIKLANFPMKYNDSYNDNFKANFMVGLQKVVRTGSISVTADAYGDVVLPKINNAEVVYKNVLRLHVQMNYTDDIENFGTISYAVDSYFWYDPKLNYPILSIETEAVDGNQPKTKVHYIPQMLTNTTNDLVRQFNFNANYNASSGRANIQFELPQPEFLSVYVLNLNGQIVSTPANNELFGEGLDQMNTYEFSHLPAGVYLVSLYYQGKTATARMLIY